MNETQTENTGILGKFFNKLKEWGQDFFEWIIEKILDLVSFIIDLLPLPEFITDGLTNTTALLPDDLKYILVKSGLPTCLAILASGVAFRLIRKFVTLFQW